MAVVRQLSGSCKAVVGQASGICQEFVKHSTGTHQEFGSHQAFWQGNNGLMRAFQSSSLLGSMQLPFYIFLVCRCLLRNFADNISNASYTKKQIVIISGKILLTRKMYIFSDRMSRLRLGLRFLFSVLNFGSCPI